MVMHGPFDRQQRYIIWYAERGRQQFSVSSLDFRPQRSVADPARPSGLVPVAAEGFAA